MRKNCFTSSSDAALDVLAYVLAGDKNSRLYKRLVYDMQVAQDVNAGHQSYRLDGMFLVDVTPKPGQTPAAMARLADEEVRKVAAEGVSRRELERAKNTMRASFLDRLASVNGKADILNHYNYIAGDPDFAQRDAARYDAVTAADVQRVARRYLVEGRRVVLSVVPEGKRDLAVTAGRP